MPLSPQSKEFSKVERYLFRTQPQPGDKVAGEDELIQALGLTRYKVRQALDLLVQMGVLPVFSSTISAKNPRKPDGTSHRAF